jgi:HAD superfamily hydrolase (TIGR01509 family)
VSTPFRAVVFDMDGLLLDSERPLVDAWTTAADALGYPFAPELLVNVLGRPGKEGVALFRSALGSEYPYEQVLVRAKALLAEARSRGYAVKPGAHELLLRLRQNGTRCAVGSSSRGAQVDELLTRARLRDFFAVTAAGDEVTQGKPAPDIFLLAAGRLLVDPRECLVFEDSEHGARAALAAGMQVVIVPDMKQPGSEARAQSLAVLSSLAEVQERFEAWFGLE